MATLTIDGAVLKIIGTDVVGADNSLNRAGLKVALFSNSCPVGNLAGKVDFIICFVNQGLQPGTFAGTDHSLQPRPLRGIIYLADGLENLPLTQIGNLLGGGIGHELGHYWLVPGAAKIRVGNAEVDTPTTQQIAQALNQGFAFPPYPIIGRQDVHWSPFIDGDSTPMEAPNLSTPIKTPGLGPLQFLSHYDQVTGQDKVGVTFALDPVGEVQTHSRFCVLERWLIGSYRPPAITSIGILWPSFLILVPRWSFPFDFQSGLYVRLRSGETWYVGFHGGPHEICAHEISRSVPTQVISIGSDPLDPHVRVGARAVQRGASIDLQVRLWAPRFILMSRAAEPVSPGPFLHFWRTRANPGVEDIMRDVAPGAPSAMDAWTGWKTIASTVGQIDHVGLSSRTLGNSSMHTLLSATLYLHQAGVTTPVSTAGFQQDFPVTGPALLPSGQLMMPYLLDDGTTIPIFEETPASHSAPKLLMAAPAGDFAFGGIVSLDRCIQVNWAGGLRTGKKMVGRAEWVKLNRVVPAGTVADRAIRTAAPLDGAYKILFCLAARTDTITAQMMSNLDLVRRAWEIFSPHLMDRNSDTVVF
jgi:hypothetical protein